MKMPRDWEFVLGDLAESRAARRRAGAGWRADAWFAFQILRAVPQLFLRRMPARERSPLMRNLVQDIRFAFRLFNAHKMFTVVAVLSLGIAIGANALVYGVADGLIFNPFPFSDPDRLVSISSAFPQVNDDERFIERHSPLEVEDFRAARSLTNVVAFDLGNRSVSNGRDLAERYLTAFVIDDPFPALQQTPHLGRGFTREELLPNGRQAVILSHRVWRTLFAGDPAIIGRQIAVNGIGREVVGVTPDGPTLFGTDLWLPWGGAANAVKRNQRQFTVLARLAPGATIESANTELRAIAARIEKDHVKEFPEYQGWRVRVATWAEAVMGGMRSAALLLVGAAAFVLLLACANLAGLVLARLSGRQRELGLRLALGARRSRLVRMLLVESLLLALAGGLLGLGIAIAALRGVSALIPPTSVTLLPSLGVSPQLIIFSLLASLVTAITVAAIPAWHASRTDPQANLRDGVTHSGTRARQRARSVLVVAEVVIAVVLLTGASLLIRSFIKIRQVDPGFDPRGVITMRLTLAWEKYQGEKSTVFFNELLDRVRAIPGVTAAATTWQFPPQAGFTQPFEVEGKLAGEARPRAITTVVTPEYFKVLGLRLMSGRVLDATDRPGGKPGVVVNKAFADQHLDGASTGRLRFGTSWIDIVGVVANARNVGLTLDPEPEIFVPAAGSSPTYQLFVIAKTTRDPRSVVPDIRSALREMDPQQPLYAIQTLEEVMRASVFEQRLMLILLQAFAAIALSLACVGVYAMVSYSVSARTREIGIRMALGADRGGVIRLVVRQSVALVATGTVIGLAGALALGRFVKSFLFNTTPTDPLALSAVVALLIGVGLLAGYLPARRAGRLDPARALRMD